jgi:hypothetical protein
MALMRGPYLLRTGGVSERQPYFEMSSAALDGNCLVDGPDWGV